jgi:hypothetical protein
MSLSELGGLVRAAPIVLSIYCSRDLHWLKLTKWQKNLFLLLAQLLKLFRFCAYDAYRVRKKFYYDPMHNLLNSFLKMCSPKKLLANLHASLNLFCFYIFFKVFCHFLFRDFLKILQ